MKLYLPLFYAHLAKLNIHYYFGEYESARNHGLEAEALVESAIGSAFLPDMNFFLSLSLIACIDLDQSKKKEYIKKVKKNQKLMKKWARFAPMNRLHKYKLVAAELARIQGKIHEAADLYEQAIDAAKENEFVQDEGLACELAAKFYISRNKHRTSRGYLIDARYAYKRWGASEKVAELDETFPGISSKTRSRRASGSQSNLMGTVSMNSTIEVGSATISMSTSGQEVSGGLDLASVMKSTQAISGEIKLEKLLNSLMKTVIENAGAQRGILILEKSGELLVAAEKNTTDV